MMSAKYIGMDVQKRGISIAVRNAAGKVVMECVIETKVTNEILPLPVSLLKSQSILPAEPILPPRPTFRKMRGGIIGAEYRAW
jgi:hypothetical protein